MKTLILILFLAVTAIGQTPRKAPSAASTKRINELAQMRADFILATDEYKASLGRLLALYEASAKRAEERLAAGKYLFAEGLIDKAQLEESERKVVAERDQVTETQRQMVAADEQIKKLPPDEQLAKEYKQAKAVRRRSSQPTCDNWTLTASRRQSRGTLVLAFKLVCRN